MRTIIGLTLSTTINVAAMAVIIPVMPFHILSVGGGAFQATIVYSIFSLASALTAPFWGRLSDWWGRKQILILSITLTGISYLWLSIADDLYQIYTARALAGIFAAWLPIAQALVSDIIESNNRTIAMGMIGAAFGIGFTIGPPIGGYLASISNEHSLSFGMQIYALPYLVAAGLALVCLITVIIGIHEPMKLKISNQVASFQKNILTQDMILPLILLYFGVSLLFTGAEGVLAVWSKTILDWQPYDVGIALMLAGLGSIITQGYLIRLTNRYLNDIHTIVIGITLLSLSFMSLSFTQHETITIVLLIVIAIGLGLNNTATQGLLGVFAPDDRRGSIMGIAQAVASLARVFGPIWAGLIFKHYGGNTPFYVGTLFSIILFFYSILLSRIYHQKFLPSIKDEHRKKQAE